MKQVNPCKAINQNLVCKTSTHEQLFNRAKQSEQNTQNMFEVDNPRLTGLTYFFFKKYTNILEKEDKKKSCF